MSALDRLSSAAIRLRGVTQDVAIGEGVKRQLSTGGIEILAEAVKACVDEPVFREALVATWEAARDVVLEQDAAAGVPTHPKCLQHGRCVEAIPCPKGKCMLTDSKLRQAVACRQIETSEGISAPAIVVGRLCRENGCDRQGWDICQHADDARTCGK